MGLAIDRQLFTSYTERRKTKKEDTMVANPVWLCVAYGRRGGRSQFHLGAAHESRILTIHFSLRAKRYELGEAYASLISFVIRVRF